MPEKETTVTIIGAGIIGGAIAEALAPHFKVIATRRKIHKLNGLEEKGVEVSQNNKEAAQKGDIIILSVKPSQVISVLKEIKEEARGKVIISFAAAIPTELMKKVASDSKIVRAMTNTAVKVRKGYTLYTHSDELEEREVAL
ncbi:NAD(P)-binding domain-containing protein, partial [Thermovirga sp.]|uniref:pyrroline-5-carboxylate reductase family protein n=1 Tax=Thermovirga sp. TaxID=2699834 RepID=UPI0025FAFBF7